MSDIEVPNISGTDHVLKAGPETIDGGAGSDVFISALVGPGATGVSTLDTGDELNGGGGEDMLKVTATGDNANASGFTLNDIEVVNIRNLTSDDTLEMDFIFANGVNTIWLENTIGKTYLTNLQDEADIVITGGPNGDPATLHVDYDDSLYNGASDSIDILVDDANADVETNDYEGGPDIENVNIVANGGDSYLELDIEGQDSWTITGNAQNLEIHQEDYNYADPFVTAGPSYSEALSSIDSTGFAGNLELSATIDNMSGGGAASVLTGAGKDDLYLMAADYYSEDVVIKTGNGKDTVEAYGFDDVTLKSGNKGDMVTVSSADGTVDVAAGKGGDNVYVSTTGDAMVDLGKGSDMASVYAGGSASVNGKGGGDWVNGNASYFYADLGGGSNYASIGGSYYVDLVAGAGNDNLTASSGWGANIDAGDGDNYVSISFGGSNINQDYAYVNTGEGSDTLYASSGSGDELVATLGKGDDYADIEGMATTSVDIKFSGGSDELETGSRGTSSSDLVDFGAGDDYLYVDNLNILSDANDLGGVSNLEYIWFGQTDNEVNFDGVTSGGNGTGVMYYVGEAGSGGTNLTNLTNGITVGLDVQDASHSDLELDLVSLGEATIGLAADGPGYYGFGDVTVTDISTLNIIAVDSDNNDIYTPTIDFGSDYFGDDGDGTLTTVNLTNDNDEGLGVANINLAADSESVEASALSVINGASMLGDVYMNLGDVAASIAVDTGAGDDYVNGDDASTAYDVDTRGGEDTINTNDLDDTIDAGEDDDEVNSGFGDDDIDLGSGDDLAVFDSAGDLTSFDTITGGAGTDTVQAESGLTDNGGLLADSFFFNWSGVEWLDLSSETDKLTLGDVANTNGPTNIMLGGGSDVVNLESGYDKTLHIYIETGSFDKVDASGVTNSDGTLKIHGDVAAFNDDTIKGGSSTGDELIMTADNGSADLTTGNYNGIETVTVLRGSPGSDDATITANGGNFDSVLNVNASDLIVTAGPTPAGAPGDLTFNGSGGKAFNVTGGAGNDSVTTGGGNDTVNSGDGNDTVTTGGGADSVNGGNGNDSITTGGGGDDTVNGDAGSDVITTGNGNDSVNGGNDADTIVTNAGNDTVNGGSGDDTITGGNGADSLTGGSNDDTFVYTAYNESRGGNSSVDTITDFGGDDVIDLSALNGGSNTFIGSYASFGAASGALTVGVAGQVVYQEDDKVLWISDGVNGLTGDDMQIVLSGVGSVDSGDLILTAV